MSQWVNNAEILCYTPLMNHSVFLCFGKVKEQRVKASSWAVPLSSFSVYPGSGWLAAAAWKERGNSFLQMHRIIYMVEGQLFFWHRHFSTSYILPAASDIRSAAPHFPPLLLLNSFPPSPHVFTQQNNQPLKEREGKQTDMGNHIQMTIFLILPVHTSIQSLMHVQLHQQWW